MAQLCRVLALVVGGWFFIACSPGDEPLPPSASARVLDVVDGDTVVVSLKDRPVSVRLIGIDTPETKKPSTPVECYGPEATAFLQSLIPPGTILILHRDIESRDHFGRLLAYLFRYDDGLFVNQEILAQGFARTLSIPPNVTYSRDFEVVANRARTEKRGLWKVCPQSAAANRSSNGTKPSASAR